MLEGFRRLLGARHIDTLALEVCACVCVCRAWAALPPAPPPVARTESMSPVDDVNRYRPSCTLAPQEKGTAFAATTGGSRGAQPRARGEVRS